MSLEYAVFYPKKIIPFFSAELTPNFCVSVSLPATLSIGKILALFNDYSLSHGYSKGRNFDGSVLQL